jgi:hypothetical protein
MDFKCCDIFSATGMVNTDQSQQQQAAPQFIQVPGGQIMVNSFI